MWIYLELNLYRKMQLHPGKKIQEELKDRGWTQRQFAFLLWKKVSEVNELIKWKRNITVQWDILLSHVLWTSRKYWLDMQNEYEYSLVESDFDISKLPNLDQKEILSVKKSHQISEPKNKSDIPPEKIKQESQIIPKEEKKETKLASQHEDNLNKEHKIVKDVYESKPQEKHQNLDDKKDQKIEKTHEKNISLTSSPVSAKSNHKKILPEWQKKLEEKNNKNDRQRIYNHNDKFDSYFSQKEKKLEHKKHDNSKYWVTKISNSDSKKNSSVLHVNTTLNKADKITELIGMVLNKIHNHSLNGRNDIQLIFRSSVRYSTSRMDVCLANWRMQYKNHWE